MLNWQILKIESALHDVMFFSLFGFINCVLWSNSFDVNVLHWDCLSVCPDSMSAVSSLVVFVLLIMNNRETGGYNPTPMIHFSGYLPSKDKNCVNEKEKWWCANVKWVRGFHKMYYKDGCVPKTFFKNQWTAPSGDHTIVNVHFLCKYGALQLEVSARSKINLTALANPCSSIFVSVSGHCNGDWFCLTN